GEAIRDTGGQDLLDDVERLRRAVIAARAGAQPADGTAASEIAALVAGWPLERAELVAKAFTVYFHLTNVAEERQRVRTLLGRAPVAPAFLRFGSWVGADRDGNPLVTAQVTREAAVIQADHALRALENATSRIGRALTVHAEAAPPGAALTLALEAAETDHPE